MFQQNKEWTHIKKVRQRRNMVWQVGREIRKCESKWEEREEKVKKSAFILFFKTGSKTLLNRLCQVV